VGRQFVLNVQCNLPKLTEWRGKDGTADTVFPGHGHCLQKPNCPFTNNDPPLMCPFINNDPPSFLVQKFFFSKKKVQTLGNFHRNTSVSGGLVGEETQKHGGGDEEGGGGFLK
jgi:hypothetical protein